MDSEKYTKKKNKKTPLHTYIRNPHTHTNYVHSSSSFYTFKRGFEKTNKQQQINLCKWSEINESPQEKYTKKK